MNSNVKITMTTSYEKNTRQIIKNKWLQIKAATKTSIQLIIKKVV